MKFKVKKIIMNLIYLIKMNKKYFFKILLLGDSATGAKTSLMQRIVNNTFDEDTISTIGYDTKSYDIETGYGIVKLKNMI
jgi:GTPase SAR1 family protein